jgi:N-acetylmuramoyl-L-alanine amidase
MPAKLVDSFKKEIAMKSLNNNYPWTKRLVLGILISTVVLLSNTTNPNSDLNEVKTVVIDAGHGGKDSGNLGTKTKTRTEKDISLDVALQVGDYIEKNFPDVNVIYTRKADKFLELSERVKIANDAQADLFISVHCNAASPKASGTETFVMGMHKSEASLRTAIRENQSIYLEDNYEERYLGFNPKDPDTYIKLSMRQNVFLNQSLSLSKKIQDQFRERVNRKDRGVKQAGYYVISYTTMPSVLVELGFLTNKEEENFLHSKKGQDHMASAIYRAFKSYKAEIEGVILESETTINSEPSLVSENSKESSKESSKQEKNKSKKKLKSPTNETLSNLKGVNYRVQIVTSSSKLELIPENFNGLTQVDEYISNGLFKYTTGICREYKEAKKLQTQIRELGYAGAFIVAFNGSEKIDLKTAIGLE